VSSLSEDLVLLERWIHELQMEWEKFFGGVERQPPHKLKIRVEQLIRQYAHSEIRNNTERFRYQTLTARYNTFSELWGRRLRAMEEGRPVAGVRTAPSVRALGETTRPSVQPIRVTSPDRDPEAVSVLFERFMEARRATGQEAAVQFESFEKLIAKQASRILAEKSATAVDFRLDTRGGKVSLKAKPVK